MEVPLPFIQTDFEGKMRVNEDVAYVLSQATEPIGVISIVGKLLSFTQETEIGDH